MTIAADAHPAPAFLRFLLPGDAHLLRHGRPLCPGADRSKANRRGADQDGAPRGWDVTYRFQSDMQLVWTLLYRGLSQGVPVDTMRELLLDPANEGAGALRCQEDPEGIFEAKLAETYPPRAPRHSARQAVELVLKLAVGGVRFSRIREAVRFGKFHNGNVDQVVDWLAARGYVTDVRTYGPNGGVGTRTITRTRRGVDYKIASAFVRFSAVLSHGRESLSQQNGHRNPMGWISKAQTSKKTPDVATLVCLGEAKLAWLHRVRRRAAGRAKGMAETARIKARREDEQRQHPGPAAVLDAAEQVRFREFVHAMVTDPPPTTMTTAPTPTRTTTPADDGVVARLRVVIHRGQAAPADHRELAHLLPA